TAGSDFLPTVAFGTCYPASAIVSFFGYSLRARQSSDRPGRPVVGELVRVREPARPLREGAVLGPKRSRAVFFHMARSVHARAAIHASGCHRAPAFSQMWRDRCVASHTVPS